MIALPSLWLQAKQWSMPCFGRSFLMSAPSRLLTSMGGLSWLEVTLLFWHYVFWLMKQIRSGATSCSQPGLCESDDSLNWEKVMRVIIWEICSVAFGTLTGSLSIMLHNMCVCCNNRWGSAGVALREVERFSQGRNGLRLPQVSDAAGLCGRLSVNRFLFQPALLQKWLLHLPPPLTPPHLSL